MLTEFNRFIEKHNLINKGDKVLLALSGGVDSMVLAKLLIMSQRVSETTRLQAETQSHCQSHCHCHRFLLSLQIVN